MEGMMLKLKLQYFGYLMGRADSLEKTLMLGGIGLLNSAPGRGTAWRRGGGYSGKGERSWRDEGAAPPKPLLRSGERAEENTVGCA